MNKNWYAVLTANVLYDKELTSRQKILLAVIVNMSNEKGYCFASNQYLAEMLNISKSSIQRDLKLLEEKGFIGRVMHLKPNGELDFRALTPIAQMTLPHSTDDTPPHSTDDTIITNNINNKFNNIPHFDIFKDYALEKKKNVCIDSLKLKYESWVENDWKNGKGKKIKNWKSTLLNTLPYIKEKSSAKKEKDNRPADEILREKWGI